MTDGDETKLIIEEALQSKREWEKFKREWEKAVRALNPNAKDKKSQAKHLATRMNKAQNFCYFTQKKHSKCSMSISTLPFFQIRLPDHNIVRGR